MVTGAFFSCCLVVLVNHGAGRETKQANSKTFGACLISRVSTQLNVTKTIGLTISRLLRTMGPQSYTQEPEPRSPTLRNETSVSERYFLLEGRTGRTQSMPGRRDCDVRPAGQVMFRFKHSDSSRFKFSFGMASSAVPNSDSSIPFAVLCWGHTGL